MKQNKQDDVISPTAVMSRRETLDRHQSSSYRHWGKRLFDFCLALIVLVFASPLMLLIWLAIILFDGRPAFYLQERIGRHRQGFKIVKFRTMRHDADKAGTVTVADDARITPIGALLRRTRLDELPQLWNVLGGDMSFVGPRPDVAGYADKLAGPDQAILDLRPGITGPAALRFAHEGDLLARAADPIAYNDQIIWPEKVRINLNYARKLSLLGDLGWICRTVLAVGGIASDGDHEPQSTTGTRARQPLRTGH